MSESAKSATRRLIYRLVSDALIEMRTAAYEGKGQNGIFKIADLFHNVPLTLERLEREDGDFEELLDSIRAHADRNDARAWLDSAIERIERAMQSSINTKA